MAWKKLYIKPNKSAQKAAKRGLEARAKAPKSKKGGLDAMQAYEMGVGSGVLRARDIVAGKRVNAYQVNAFFNRHRHNYINAKLKGLKPEKSRAIQSWLLWGGEPLRKQVARAVEKDKAERNPIETRSLTDNEIEDQIAAIGCLLEESARESEDSPHGAERRLPRTRRVWELYKSLEKEQDRRRRERNPMPPMRDYDPWTMFLFMKAGEKDVLTLPDGHNDLMHRKIIDEADLLDYDINYLHDADGGTIAVINLPTGPARLKAKRFMEIWEKKWQGSPEDYEETDEDYIEMGFLLDYDKTQTLQKVGRIGKRRGERDERWELEAAIAQTCRRKAYKERAFDTNEKFSLDDLLTADKAVPQRLEDMQKAQDAYCDAETRFHVIFEKLSSEDKKKAFELVGAQRNPMPRRNDEYPSEWLFEQLMNGNKKVLWLHNYADYRDEGWRKEAEEKGFKTIVIKLREEDFESNKWSEMIEGMGVDAPDGAVPEEWIVYEDSKDGKGKAQRFKKILTGEANLTREGYLRELGDILGYDKEQTNEMAVPSFIPAEELMKTIDEYCGRTERPVAETVNRQRNPSIPSMFGYEKSRLTKVRFPTPSDAPYGGESMWVRIVQGDENSGIGTIDNYPQFFDLADYGDMIKYGGGTDRLKPEFESVVECKPIPRPERNPIFDKVPDNVKDPMLYRKARAKVKGRVSVWPSAYASGQLVQEYKRMGGEYINPKKRKKKQDETRAQEARRLLGLRAPATTGGGLHTDKKKEASRKGARKKIRASDYE